MRPGGTPRSTRDRLTFSARRPTPVGSTETRARAAARRRHRHQIDIRVWTLFQRLAHRVVHRLFVPDIGPVEADHHQRRPVADIGRGPAGRRPPARRRPSPRQSSPSAGLAASIRSLPILAASWSRLLRSAETNTVWRRISSLASPSKRPASTAVRSTSFRRLARFRRSPSPMPGTREVARTESPEAGRRLGVTDHRAAKLVQRVDVAPQLVEVGLGGVELLPEIRVGRGSSRLEPGVDGGDGSPVAPRIGVDFCPDFLELGGVPRDRGPQALEFAPRFAHRLPDTRRVRGPRAGGTGRAARDGRGPDRPIGLPGPQRATREHEQGRHGGRRSPQHDHMSTVSLTTRRCRFKADNHFETCE